ncbi:MAG: sigma-70 family RNA polymerase sigma factor, partial [Myxococcota bacterium]
MSIETKTAALRRLARALVEQSADADDLVQDTFIAALERPPSRDRPLLPWLSQVLRNRRVSLFRASSRASAREAAAPSFNDAVAPDDRVLYSELRDELEQLPSDDRDVLVLRYVEGLTAVECATQLGHTASTVRSRHHRALKRLRSALDERHGGRKAWLGGMALWLERPAAVAPRATVFNAANLTVGGALAAGALWLVAIAPHGCGGATEVAAEVETVAP